MRAHAKLPANAKLRDVFIYKHFHGPGDNGLEDVSVQLIDRVNDERNLLDEQEQLAYKLKCLKPYGLNESDFFFDQNRSARVRSS